MTRAITRNGEGRKGKTVMEKSGTENVEGVTKKKRRGTVKMIDGRTG